SQNERPETVERSPNCDGRKNKDASSSFTLRKSKRGPDDDRTANKRDRIIPRGNWKPSAEHGFGQHDEQQQEHGDFERLLPVPLSLCGRYAPKQKQRSYHQNSGSIAEPPGSPDWPVA